MSRYRYESSCRYEAGREPGDPNMIYEFDIKMPKLAVDMTDDEFGEEAHFALDDLRKKLRNRYTWISKMYQQGGSGGWWVIEDKTGGATKAKLRTIIGIVEAAKKKFIEHIEREYPAR